VTGPGRAGAATLSRELADFLVEFSIALHKRAMYPPDHPHLRTSADRFVRRLESLCELREQVILGVSQHQLLIEGAATDPQNALLRELAQRLHRHRIASVTLVRGASLNEIDDLLTSLSGDPRGERGPLGRRLPPADASPHVRLQAIGYERLVLQDGTDAPEPEVRRDPQSLWVGLAQLALPTSDGPLDEDAEPLVVAQAIDRGDAEVAYDRVVLDYLSQVAEEMSGRASPGETRLRDRVSKLIGAMQPETLKRLLEAGADHAERQKFALTASQVLAVDAVVEVVEAAAATSGQAISHQLLRLLHKIAQHAQQGSAAMRTEADAALRKNVGRLVASWGLEDPNPAEYTRVLEGMVRVAPTSSDPITEPRPEPVEILQMALEVGVAGDRVLAALGALLDGGRMPDVIDVLDRAPHADTAAELWRHVATPDRLRAALAERPFDAGIVNRLTERLGRDAIDPVLDVLGTAADRATRAHALRLLGAFGPAAARAAARRLPGSPWFVQRNILVLLARLGEWPHDFDPQPYATHQDPRVRREALKMLLGTTRWRTGALVAALEDRDERIRRLGLVAALRQCPSEATRLVEQMVSNPRTEPDVRALGIRVLARAQAGAFLPRLLGLSTSRRWFGPRLAPKSPEVLAAVSALASYFREDPRAAAVLGQALRHPDPEIRAAAASA
jgi:hypothetical protein